MLDIIIKYLNIEWHNKNKKMQSHDWLNFDWHLTGKSVISGVFVIFLVSLYDNKYNFLDKSHLGKFISIISLLTSNNLTEYQNHRYKTRDCKCRYKHELTTF